MSDNLLTPELLQFIREQQDRQAIQDCLLRYTRGVDRHDLQLMQSAYHRDAIDEHGVAQGDPESFCAWAIGYHAEHQLQHHHIITNSTIELDGDTAHAESYYMFWADNRQGSPTLSFGRYIDRFEKRAGNWGIAHRVCINQQTTTLSETDMPAEWVKIMKSTGPSSRDRNDISYDRPLEKSRGPSTR